MFFLEHAGDLRINILRRWVKTPREHRFCFVFIRGKQKPLETWQCMWCKPQSRENPCKLRQKSRLNSQKKITRVDDMMIYNLAKYLFQTRLPL